MAVTPDGNSQNLPDEYKLSRKAAPSRLTGFVEFVNDVRYLSLMICLAAAAGCLVALVKLIGPPWPEAAAIALFTVLFQFVAYIWCFVFYLQSHGGAGVERLEKLLRNAILVFVIIMISYLLIFAFLVIRLDDKGNTEARGFVYEAWVNDYCKQNPGCDDIKLLQAAGGNGEQVFQAWSLYTSRLVILLSWIATYTALSFLLCLFVIRQYRTRAKATRS